MKQIGGDHYSKHKFDIFDISDEYNLDPREHTIIKYVLRHKDKGGIQDLKKAKSVLDGLIERLEGQSLKECVDGACAMPKRPKSIYGAWDD
jgi:hypothetical protein